MNLLELQVLAVVSGIPGGTDAWSSDSQRDPYSAHTPAADDVAGQAEPPAVVAASTEPPA